MGYSYDSFFNWTTEGHTSDSVATRPKAFYRWAGAWFLSMAGRTVAQAVVCAGHFTLIVCVLCLFLVVQCVGLWIVAFPGQSHWFVWLNISKTMAACSFCVSSFWYVSRCCSQCQYMTKSAALYNLAKRRFWNKTNFSYYDDKKIL